MEFANLKPKAKYIKNPKSLVLTGFLYKGNYDSNPSFRTWCNNCVIIILKKRKEIRKEHTYRHINFFF